MTTKSIRDYINLIENIQSQGMAEGIAADDSVNYTSDHPVDKEYVYSVYRNGEKEGTYHSLEQAKQVLANLKKTHYYKRFWDKYKINRSPRSKLAGPVGQLPEDKGVAEGSEENFKVGDKVRFKNRTQPAKFMTITDIDTNMFDTKIKLDLASGWWNPGSLVHYNEQGVAEEQLEETSPEAIKKINELTRRP